MGGVVMHNLRRVAAGLRGEHLEPEMTPEPEEEEGRDNKSSKKSGGGLKGKRGKAAQQGTGEAAEGWQDMSEYEREEGVVEVLEDATERERDNFVRSGGEVPEVVDTEEVDGEGEGEDEEGGRKRKKAGGEADAKMDKAARKMAKKERNKEFKRDKEKKRSKKGE